MKVFSKKWLIFKPALHFQQSGRQQAAIPNKFSMDSGIFRYHSSKQTNIRLTNKQKTLKANHRILWFHKEIYDVAKKHLLLRLVFIIGICTYIFKLKNAIYYLMKYLWAARKTYVAGCFRFCALRFTWIKLRFSKRNQSSLLRFFEVPWRI